MTTQIFDPTYSALRYTWPAHARPEQLAPAGDWFVWLALAGRGWGKTRAGAEWVRWRVESGLAKRIALVGQTSFAVRETMLEGESGLLNVFPKAQRPRYIASRRRVEFHNGAQAFVYSSDSPDLLRGPQHDTAWGDEPTYWIALQEAYDNLIMGLRLGSCPQLLCTCTPRPLEWLKKLKTQTSTVCTGGNMYQNIRNLAPQFIQEIKDKYEGTRLGRQEIYAEIIDDNEKALWKREWIDKARVIKAPELRRIVVAVDPAVSANKNSDETGITVQAKGIDGEFYFLEDCTVKMASPNEWAKVAVTAYHRHKADCIVCEGNQGGDMVTHTVRTVDKNVPVKKIHASRGKSVRAEPAAALCEQGRVHFVGNFAALEDQLCQWDSTVSSYSPDRLDSHVHGINELIGRSEPGKVTVQKW